MDYMKIDPRLLPYIPLVEYIGKVFGENCEVILHDLSDVEHSIIAIENGHLTNRQVGGHITDFGLKVVYDPKYRQKAYAVNYPGTTPDGNTKTKSSTFFIRDDSGTIIGLFCINIDITNLIKANQTIAKLISFDDSESSLMTCEDEEQHATQETFSTSIDEILRSSIDRVLSEVKVPPQRMTANEKINVVQQLHSYGIFALKGAVSMVAKGLDISEQSVYRYLKEIQND